MFKIIYTFEFNKKEIHIYNTFLEPLFNRNEIICKPTVNDICFIDEYDLCFLLNKKSILKDIIISIIRMERKRLYKVAFA